MTTKVQAIKELGSALGVTVEGSTIADSIHSLVRGMGATDSKYSDEGTIAASIADLADAVEDEAISVGGGVPLATLTVTRDREDNFSLNGLTYILENGGKVWVANGWSNMNMEGLSAGISIPAGGGYGQFVEIESNYPNVTTSGAIEYDEEEGGYNITGDASITFSYPN